MKKYKISESNLKEFWGWFGKKKPQSLQQIINSDPVLRKIDRDISDKMDSQIPYLLKIKKERPEDWDWMVKSGLVSNDLK
jgi:hypothetical protein